MATQLIVEFGNTKHRFVKNTTVELVLTGPPETALKGSVPGKHMFAISSASVGNSLTLRIRIPAPPVLAAAGTTNLLDVKQVLEVVRTPAGVVTLVPHKTSPGNRFVGGFHPRLTGHLKAAGAGHLFVIALDNTFLDVSELARKGNPEYLKPYDAATPILAGAAPHYGAKLRLMEYTGGKPTLWVVVIPDAVTPALKSVHLLLFFRPIGDAPQKYTFIDEAPLLKPRPVVRYLLDPSASTGPFFVVNFRGARKLTKTQLCGLERQVAEARKPLVFATPVPHSGDFGDSCNKNWSRLMPSLMLALWAGDAVGQSVPQGLALKRIAIGGFSHGAKVTLAALAAHPEVVDECYLFDPPTFGDAQTSVISGWTKRGGKRLRLIGGGMVHEALIAFAAGKGPNVTVNPAKADYWLTSPLYLAAINMTKFDSSLATAAAPQSLSGLTGLFHIGPASRGIGVAMQGRNSSNAVVVAARDVSSMGAEELAADGAAYVECFLDAKCKVALDAEFAKLKPSVKAPKVPLGSSAEFDALIGGLTRRVRGMRHQWTVVGGEDSGGKADRQGTFKGFLQLCIEQGDFP